MSLVENYIRASNSSHLEWRPTIADIDYLVAAGKVSDGLATRLIRLRSDFDAVSAVTESDVLKTLLRGFRPTFAYLLAHARNEAALKKLSQTAHETAEIADKVLDIFLEPHCRICSGRGATGTYGSPQLRCTACKESGKRHAYWKNDRQEQFAGWLETSIDRKVQSAIDEMRALLR